MSTFGEYQNVPSTHDRREKTNEHEKREKPRSNSTKYIDPLLFSRYFSLLHVLFLLHRFPSFKNIYIERAKTCFGEKRSLKEFHELNVFSFFLLSSIFLAFLSPALFFLEPLKYHFPSNIKDYRETNTRTKENKRIHRQKGNVIWF
jgi:hypothetical protein